MTSGRPPVSPGEDLLAVSAHLPRVDLDSGAVVVEQDCPVAGLYVLIEGRVVMTREGAQLAVISQPGAVFGDLATILGQPAPVTARTSAPSSFYLAADADEFLSRPGVALAVLRSTAVRLDAMIRYLADVRAQYDDVGGGHLGMVDGVLTALLNHPANPVQVRSARDPDG